MEAPVGVLLWAVLSPPALLPALTGADEQTQKQLLDLSAGPGTPQAATNNLVSFEVVSAISSQHHEMNNILFIVAS